MTADMSCCIPWVYTAGGKLQRPYDHFRMIRPVAVDAAQCIWKTRIVPLETSPASRLACSAACRSNLRNCRCAAFVADGLERVSLRQLDVFDIHSLPADPAQQRAFFMDVTFDDDADAAAAA